MSKNKDSFYLQRIKNTLLKESDRGIRSVEAPFALYDALRVIVEHAEEIEKLKKKIKNLKG